MDFNWQRLQRLFDPKAMIQPNFGSQMPQIDFNSPDFNPSDVPMEMNQSPIMNTMGGAQLNYPATDQFNQLLEQFPQRNDPGIIRKIGASLAALGGTPQSQIEQSLYAPFYRQLEDWEAKLKPAQAAMTNERQFAALDERQRASQAKEELARFKANNPTWKLMETKGGNIVAINPQNPAQKIDTKIPTGTLSDLDKINFQIQGQEKLLETRGKQATVLEGTRQTNRHSNILFTGQQNRETKKTVGGGTNTTNKPELPTQNKQRILNNAQKALIEHPEWADYITIQDGQVEVAPASEPGMFSKGFPETTRKQISDYILGTDTTVGRVNPETKNTSIPSKSTDDKRNRAIAQLQKDGKPVTEANIKYVMDRLK